MSKEEIIDVLDTEGNVVDTISRSQAERDNHTTHNVLVFIFNSFGKVWIQLRPKTKSHYPGVWDISACGGVVSGETPEEAAKRETHEETGLKPELHYVETFLNVFPGDQGEERKRMSHLYIATSDEVPQPNEEVDEFKSWQPDELRKDIEEHQDRYVPSFITELDLAVKAHQQLLRP